MGKPIFYVHQHFWADQVIAVGKGSVLQLKPNNLIKS